MSRMIGLLTIGWVCTFAQAEALSVKGTQFFLDDHLIEEMKGLKREFHPVTKKGVVKDNDAPWETLTGGNYVQVFKDKDRWHMYYTAIWWTRSAYESEGDASQAYNFHVCYATSQDGLKWTRPVIGKIATPSSAEGGWNGRVKGIGSTRENNALMDGQLTTAFWDEQRRSGKKILFNSVLTQLFGSDDGLIFEPVGKPPPRKSVFGMFYNEEDRRWELYTQGVAGAEFPRKIGRQLSPDLENWTAELSLEPDDQDPQSPERFDEFMAMSVRREPNLTIGFLTVFHSDRTDPRYTDIYGSAWRKGTTEIQLVSSRDGKNWTRLGDRKPWIPHGLEEHSYDRLVMLGNGGLRVGDELWFYYEAWDGDHLTFDAKGKIYYPDHRLRQGRVALAVIRLDGYISLRPEKDQGVVTTKMFHLKSESLFVNADAKDHELRVEILDEQGEPLDGFATTDCEPITTDNVRIPVKWRSGDLKSLQGKTIRLRFHLTGGDLYTFSLEDKEKPASSPN